MFLVPLRIICFPQDIYYLFEIQWLRIQFQKRKDISPAATEKPILKSHSEHVNGTYLLALYIASNG